MKDYEGREDRRLLPQLPVLARIDGRCFSNWTRDLDRPYDRRMIYLMRDTAQYVLEESHAVIAYTQSDEITLLYYSDDYDSQIFFDGRIQKLASVLASAATAHFNAAARGYFSDRPLAQFDCRVWNVPNKAEAANVFLWREIDATKNSIQSAARSVYSHNECHGKNGKQLQEMLHERGINWNDYPDDFKRGTFIRKQEIEREYTAEELEELPPKHHAHTNPDLLVKRVVTRTETLPPLLKTENRVDVIFDGAEPLPIQRADL